MLSTYREVLRIPGAWRFSAAAFLARLPMSIVGLGIVIYISGVSGSYAIAGILAAAFQLSAAGFALVTSRLVDHHGQHLVLPILAALHAIALIAFIGTVEFGLPLVIQGLTVAIAGASQPAIGAVVRARWAYVISRQEDTSSPKLRGAFALESIVDELIFTLGPLIVATMALRLSLASPLILAALLAVVGVVLLAAQRATEPPPTRSPSVIALRPRSTIRLPGMPAAVLAAMGVGFIFGSYEVTAIAFTEQQGSPGAVGLVLALWALGSMAGGLWFGSRHWQIRLPSQSLCCAGVLALVLIPQPFIQSVAVLAAVTFISGAAVAPALISGFSLAERLVPNAQLTEGLTWSNSGLAVGFSAGAAVAGLVVDALGTATSFTLPVLGALFAVLVLAASRRTLLAAVVPYRVGPPGAPLNSDPIAGPAPGAYLDDAN